MITDGFQERVDGAEACLGKVTHGGRVTSEVEISGPRAWSSRVVREVRDDPIRLVVFVFLLLTTFVMLYPFYFMVRNSFMSSSQYIAGHGISTRSWTQLFSALPVWREMLNSTLICAASITIIVLCSTMAGFTFAKLAFRGRGFAFVAIIGCMMIPVQSIIIPEYVNLAHLGLINNYLSAILVYGALGTPFATFLMTAYFRGLPEEVIEAGLCDGLTYSKVYWRIALPMARPALVTVVVLQFIQIWDDLLVGLLFLQEPTNRTITVGLAALSSGRVVSIPILMAGAIMSALPAIAVYLVFQRYLIAGLTLGVSK